MNNRDVAPHIDMMLIGSEPSNQYVNAESNLPTVDNEVVISDNVGDDDPANARWDEDTNAIKA